MSLINFGDAHRQLGSQKGGCRTVLFWIGYGWQAALKPWIMAYAPEVHPACAKVQLVDIDHVRGLRREVLTVINHLSPLRTDYVSAGGHASVTGFLNIDIDFVLIDFVAASSELVSSPQLIDVSQTRVLRKLLFNARDESFLRFGRGAADHCE